MFREKDIEVDSEHDLVIDSDGDLKMASPQQTLSQDISFRICTDHHDYSPSPFIGANLRTFVGEPNVPRTAQLITDSVIISLTQDRRIPAQVLFVDTVPIEIHKVLVMALVNESVENATEATVVTKVIDLDTIGTEQESILNTTED
jgi:hypothetical protein